MRAQRDQRLALGVLSYVYSYISIYTTLAGTARVKTMRPELLNLIAEQFKALSDPSRLALLQALRSGERTVNELVAATDISQANVSRHMALLFAQRLVKRTRDGVFVRYSLADNDVLKLCELVWGRLETELSSRRKAVTGR